jgi:hypothetical protein
MCPRAAAIEARQRSRRPTSGSEAKFNLIEFSETTGIAPIYSADCNVIALSAYQWRSHCHGLCQLPALAWCRTHVRHRDEQRRLFNDHLRLQEHRRQPVFKDGAFVRSSKATEGVYRESTDQRTSIDETVLREPHSPFRIEDNITRPLARRSPERL